ncbi:hypothetical protein BpHYR1_027734 [Brachionus plicatilis]|uniref:Uncharacterized protein n=1 Tax=Brachionus plicatilis TaxID=10195 RepID=A0A3M7SLD2_BRAPC|nr:hypothetical protein BpHYR1_027734 [Brachionus plicatilis]
MGSMIRSPRNKTRIFGFSLHAFLQGYAIILLIVAPLHYSWFLFAYKWQIRGSSREQQNV